MTTVNNDEIVNKISGFPPQVYSFLTNPTTRPIFASIVIILKVYPVLVFILGSFGNLLSFCVLLRKNMRKYSTFCYLACLALVDLGVIIVFCVNFIFLYHFDHDIQDEPFTCNLFAFCIYFLPQYSSWILVAVSIDRVISAKYLRLAKTWSTPKHSVLVTVLLGIVLGLLNSHFFIYENNSLKQREADRLNALNQTALGKVPTPDQFAHQSTDEFSVMNSFSSAGFISSSSVLYESFTPLPSAPPIPQDTTIQQQYESYVSLSPDVIASFDVNIIYCSLENSPNHASLHVVWVWIDLLMNVFLPFTAMIACTIIIILTLIRSSTRSGSTSVRRSRRRRNVSVMLITVNLVFITLTAPIVIFLSVYHNVRDPNNGYRQVTLILIKIFCIILMNLNHSVNIIIYSVTAKEFRLEMNNFLHALLYCIIGKPTNPNDFGYEQNEGTLSARFRRLRLNLFQCCHFKASSNSANTTDSGTLPHPSSTAMNKLSSKDNGILRNKSKQQKELNLNGQRQSMISRFGEAHAPRRSGQHLTVKLQPDKASIAFEQDVLLHVASNSTEH